VEAASVGGTLNHANCRISY